MSLPGRVIVEEFRPGGRYKIDSSNGSVFELFKYVA